MGSMAARSSLEQMLDSIRQRDEGPMNAPPALPTRPVKRGRLPTARRPLPVEFMTTKDVQEMEAAAQPRQGVMFGSRRQRSMAEGPRESPCAPEAGNSGRSSSYEGDEPDASLPSMSSSSLSSWCSSLKEKSRVWCCLPNGDWELGEIQSFSAEDAHISVPDGRVLRISTKSILPANPDLLDGVDDLLQLSYFNEPSFLHTLRHRYSSDKIYTKAGPILLALNPLTDVPLYGGDPISAYRGRTINPPHVYAMAEDAYTRMMSEEVDQSIIISGESGAGKTEVAKIAMQYLVALSGGSSIENQVSKANFILESFGNAKTSKNSNSSRFGKLMEFSFSSSGEICGAKIQTFFLEKSRVVQRATNERSFHIFYQLCAGAPRFLRERLELRAASEYDYLKQSVCLTIDHIDDAKRFHLLVEALDSVQIPKKDQEEVFAMLAAVLWLGNISLSAIDEENLVEVVPSEGLNNSARLLGCSGQNLIMAISTCRIQTEKGMLIQKLTLAQAIDARDSLAKFIYVSLFDWLVNLINKSLEVGKSHPDKSIMILDIFGFESFHKNGFEQFCINYANEKLQQHFNRHLFKLEQEEYILDGIDWTRVDFIDNTECLNLFEKKPMGLLSILDEESSFPNSTDFTFACKLKENFKDDRCFKGQRDGAFSVCHYAGEVSYNTCGFLEKNRDPLHSDSIELLLLSCLPLPKLLGRNLPDHSETVTTCGRSNGAGAEKQGVCIKFKNLLFKLMQRLENTTPHFIRCIKPNDKQLPGLYENDVVLQQLRCCGVLEVMRISRVGYPTRRTHESFAKRYGFLLSENVASQDPLSVSVAILRQFNISPDMYQVGFTRLFFRTGQIALLEDARSRTLGGVLSVQKHFRGFRARHNFKGLLDATTILQSFVRGENARKELKSAVRRWRAAGRLQKHVRRWIAQRLFNQHKRAAITFQSVLRGYMARKCLCNLRQERLVAVAKCGVIKNTFDNAPEKMKHHVPGLEELQRRIFMVQKALQEKEEENASLHRELRQCEVRWADYEMKMRSMEEMWQKQLVSLQASLAEARSRLPADDVATHPVKVNAMSPVPHLYDSEDAISVDMHTPEATPPRISRPSTNSRPLSRDSDGVPHLLREFEQKKQGFEDDARFLFEAKPGVASAVDELRKLKHQFIAWKKEYKVKLHETKMALQKAANPESGKSNRRTWWGKLSAK